jgi:hypothetical protein
MFPIKGRKLLRYGGHPESMLKSQQSYFLDIDPAEHVIYEGVLSGIPLGHLEPGESRTLETAVVFLSQLKRESLAHREASGAEGGDLKVPPRGQAACKIPNSAEHVLA